MASKVYDFSLGAALGASQRFDVRGNYFKLTASTGPVVVRADTGEEWALEAGQGFRLPAERPFAAVSVRNARATACAGSVFIGDSFFEDSRIAGNVAIVDKIGPTCESQFLFDLAVGLAVQTFVAAAANVRGIIVRSSFVEVTAGAGGTANGRILAAASVPVSLTPGAQSIILNTGFSGSSTDVVRNAVPDSARLLPVGWGLYFAKNVQVAAATACTGTCSFEVL